MNTKDMHSTPNPIVERFKFNSRNRHRNEKICSFVTSLRQLTEFCEFGNTVDIMLRDRLVCGINNNKIQTRLLSEGRTLDFDRALELSLIMESADENGSTIGIFQSIQSSSLYLAETGKNELNVIQNTPKKSPDVSSMCEHCGGRNEKLDKFLFKEKECFFCRIKNHTIKVCRRRQKNRNVNKKLSKKKQQPTRDSNNKEVREESSDDCMNNMIYPLAIFSI